MSDTLTVDTVTDNPTQVTTYGGFKTYTQHLYALGEANPGLFLGLLVWYTVPESLMIDYQEFTKLAIEADAAVAVKKAPKAWDVFLRACTHVENGHKKLPTDQPNTYRNYLIRKAGTNADLVCKQVVMELVDQDNNQLDFGVMGDLRFNKRESSIEGSPLDEDDEEFSKIVKEVSAYCDTMQGMLTSYTVRECFRQSMEGPLMAVSVRTAGGVYFVNPSKSEELAALEALATAIDGITFNVMPLIDDGNQRAMLKAAFEDDSVGELQKLMGEMQELIAKGGKVTDKQVAAFQERYTVLRTRTKNYAELLDDSLETASASLQLCMQTIKNIYKKLES